MMEKIQQWLPLRGCLAACGQHVDWWARHTLFCSFLKEHISFWLCVSLQISIVSFLNIYILLHFRFGVHLKNMQDCCIGTYICGFSLPPHHLYLDGFQVHPCPYKGHKLIIFYGCIVFHGIYVPHFPCPVYHWWAFGLIPCLCCCEQCIENMCAFVSMVEWFIYFWLYTQ